MNSTLGQAFVLGGLACAVFGAVVGIESGLRRRESTFPWVLRAVYGFFACMVLANVTMEHALITHDFSVKYVSLVGSRSTPLVYTMVSLWSALEGSILFWGAILSIYIFAFARAHRKEHARYMSLALGTMLAVGVFFAFLIAGPANPFTAVFPVLPDGPGPNPLLQNHVLMVIHPPMLYLGYVGMVVPFGVAFAALLRGELSTAWMGPLRRWTLIGWTFLSVGIILGSWWAYAVLGWGGYWAWDPVENASFLPWLTATAFIHSTMVQERKHILKLWTLSLALGTFVLTMLGTFMTRSGVFNSVHSFTQSDIGPTFLVFIGIVLFASIAMLGLRGHLLVAEQDIQSLVSRESAILLNNLLFVAITFTVLLGTLYPLISEAVRGVRISVGEPYFNKLAVPGGVAVLFLMGVGPVLPWGRPDGAAVRRQFLIPAAMGLLVVGGCFAAGLRGGLPLLTFGLCGFVSTVTLREMFLPAAVRVREKKESFPKAIFESARRARRRFGGYTVHLGVVMVFAAIAASRSYSTHTEKTLTFADPLLQVNGYQVKFQGIESGADARRSWKGASLLLTAPSGKTESLSPRMNYYARSTDPVGSPAVRTGLLSDFYVSLRAYTEGANPSATLSTFMFPLVSWIWWSLPFFVIGSLIAMWPSRRARGAVATIDPIAVAEAPVDLNRGAA